MTYCEHINAISGQYEVVSDAIFGKGVKDVVAHPLVKFEVVG